jgi:anti-anti-sigma regulatory factor
MNFDITDTGAGCCVTFEGGMICKNSRATERFILDMVKQYRHLKVDLSEVNEIDRCGVHLLAMIKSFGPEFVEIVATSPVIDVALVHIPATRRKQPPVKNLLTPLPTHVPPPQPALSV